jgi:NhaP-type Na+/H+ or K+/H+ antiporter
MCVENNNHTVRDQEFARGLRANGSTFSMSNCYFGPNYPQRNRILILLLCTGAALVTTFVKRKSLAMLLTLFLYSLAALLAYQWISWMVHALSMNESYHADTPYLARVASSLDWLMFAGLAITIVANIALLNKAVSEPPLA